MQHGATGSDVARRQSLGRHNRGMISKIVLNRIKMMFLQPCFLRLPGLPTGSAHGY
jgi:hypothetical protein